MDVTTTREAEPRPEPLHVKGWPAPRPLRIGLGLVLITATAALLVLDASWGAGFVYAAVAVGAVALALDEFTALAVRLEVGLDRQVVIAGGVCLFLVQWAGWSVNWFGPWLGAVALLCGMTMADLVVRISRAGIDGALQGAGAAAAAWIYVPLMLGFLTAVRLHWGVAGLVTVLATCKTSSTAAYLAGTFLGRRKLAPAISPGKTVAGAVGALVGGVAAAWLVSVSPLSLMSPAAAVAFGLLVSVAGMYGDLAASLLKRQAKVKDSGALLPGFGGMLDMMDDVLFAAPVGFLFLHVHDMISQAR